MSESIDGNVLDYYERGGESDRLTRSAHGRLEFERTRAILSSLLGRRPQRILDVGGGMGVHARWLAEDGHDVTVIDPVPSHVAAAARLPGVTAVLGDARRLEAPLGSADAVLLFGPLYHLMSHQDRVTAIREAARVTRPGGLIAAATISRYAAWLDAARRASFGDDTEDAVLRLVAQTGVIDPHRFGSPNFTTAYTHLPGEADAEFTHAGLAAPATVAVEGGAWLVGDLGAILDDPVARERMMAGLRAMEREPTLLGVSSHLLTYARR
ncbi:hypothetical protein Afil01_36270 [Actinorhabdospora filicis]|uniref:Methyltransferase domain-containing protein n=1 Tax=Actinorhabdospora filicis TaxID=1785913 RepID=A0A9W6SKS9_9ACTN|nr:class I SAM-dependent methyltransferase [Actinorhabdospora filicis]GLZ78820.1 hypothetical protein Afil01_36270 [Actinorhabdospora filicis]